MKYRGRIWDSVAQDYDVIWEVPDYTPILQSIVQEARINVGMEVLDVATGTGMIGMEVARRVGESGRVLGVDTSRPMLKEAIRKARTAGMHNVDFILADAHNLPLRDKHFDAVTSCFAFAFLSNPQEAADEMARVVAPGGSVASVEWEKPPLDFWAELREKGGIRDIPESELIETLYSSGFRNIRTRRIQILHRRPGASDELVRRSQLVVVRLMGLKEKDAEWFFPKMREEYRRLPNEKRGWLPVLYVGTKY